MTQEGRGFSALLLHRKASRKSHRSCFARSLPGLASLDHRSQYLATVCFANMDTFEVLAPPGPRTLSWSLHQKILGHFRAPRAAGTSDIFEVLANLVRFKYPGTSDTAETSDTFEIFAPQDPPETCEVLALQDPRELSSSPDSRNLGHFRGPCKPRTLRNSSLRNLCGKKPKTNARLNVNLSKIVTKNRFRANLVELELCTVIWQ